MTAPPTACDELLLDLTGVEFIDSAGLGGLLELRSTLRARSVTLEISAGEGPVRQAMEITGLSELLAACQSRTGQCSAGPRSPRRSPAT